MYVKINERERPKGIVAQERGKQKRREGREGE